MSRSRYYPGPSARSLRTHGGHVPKRDRARDAHHRSMVDLGEEEYLDTRGDWLPVARLDYASTGAAHAARASLLSPRRRKKAAPHVLARRERRVAAFVRGMMAASLPTADSNIRFCLSCSTVVNFMTHECGGRD